MEKVYQHEVLGKLRYDQKMEWYVGELNFGGDVVDVCLPAEDENDLQNSIKQFAKIYDKLAEIDVSAKEFAAKELLAEKNSEWLGEGETPIESKEFIERMALESIIIGSGSSTELFYDDDGMFFDHAILLTRHSDGHFVDAEVAD